MRAAVPVTVGQAMLVPLILAYVLPGMVLHTSTPLAQMVGNRRPSSCGPRLEVLESSPTSFTAPTWIAFFARLVLVP